MTLSNALAALDATRVSILADLDALTPDQRAFVPAAGSSAGSWSPEQVAEHLHTVERGILAGIQSSAGSDLGAPSREGVEGIISFMGTDQRAQTPPFLHPKGAPYAESRRGLEAVGADWHALAESHADDSGGPAVFVHPFAGPMMLLDTLRFVESHAGHHRHQLERIRADEGFPA